MLSLCLASGPLSPVLSRILMGLVFCCCCQFELFSWFVWCSDEAAEHWPCHGSSCHFGWPVTDGVNIKGQPVQHPEQSVAPGYGHEPWYGHLLSPVSDLIDVSECDKKEEETFGNIVITYLNLEHSCLNAFAAFARCILPRSWGWGSSGSCERENMCQWYSAAVLSASGPVVFSTFIFIFWAAVCFSFIKCTSGI